MEDCEGGTVAREGRAIETTEEDVMESLDQLLDLHHRLQKADYCLQGLTAVEEDSDGVSESGNEDNSAQPATTQRELRCTARPPKVLVKPLVMRVDETDHAASPAQPVLTCRSLQASNAAAEPRAGQQKTSKLASPRRCMDDAGPAGGHCKQRLRGSPEYRARHDLLKSTVRNDDSGILKRMIEKDQPTEFSLSDMALRSHNLNVSAKANRRCRKSSETSPEKFHEDRSPEGVRSVGHSPGPDRFARKLNGQGSAKSGSVTWTLSPFNGSLPATLERTRSRSHSPPRSSNLFPCPAAASRASVRPRTVVANLYGGLVPLLSGTDQFHVKLGDKGALHRYGNSHYAAVGALSDTSACDRKEPKN